MKTEIINRLAQIETDFDVKILYAIESGSRAWGFESTDSDYDIRFFYIHRPEWYLSIEEKRDVIELPINDILDISGWEIKKALKLFQKSNATLLEWMRSPILYMQETSFIEDLRKIELDYFSPKAAIYNYLNSAKRNTKRYLKHEEVMIKKYFYSLRPLLCCIWIEEKKTPPPMEFSTLLDHYNGSADFKSEIKSLLVRKMSGEEMDLEPRNRVLDEFILDRSSYFEQSVSTLDELPAPSVNKLDELFRKMLKDVWGDLF